MVSECCLMMRNLDLTMIMSGFQGTLIIKHVGTQLINHG